MRNLPLRVAALLALSAAPAVADPHPPAIYINGVRVDGLKGQTLANVEVRFDENGDVRIHAPSYHVTALEREAPSAAPAARSEAGPATPLAGRRYFVASQESRPGAAQWDVDVFVNRVFVKHFRSRDTNPVQEITRWLHPGPNVIHFAAKKAPGPRTSTSPDDWFELSVGDGTEARGVVTVNRVAGFRRTAAETGEYDAETTLTVAAATP